MTIQEAKKLQKDQIIQIRSYGKNYRAKFIEIKEDNTVILDIEGVLRIFYLFELDLKV